MFDSIFSMSGCSGGLFMGAFWFLIIMAGISVFKSLFNSPGKEI